jgi:hypothetical protein
MACLSVFKEGLFVICANSIFPTSDVDLRAGATLTFEVFEGNATSLRLRLGEEHQYMLDGQAFSGRLMKLEPCQSSHPGLSFLRDNPTLLGLLEISNLGAPA